MDTKAASQASGLLGSFVKSVGTSVMGTAALTREDIQPALVQLKRKLMERNVAEEIAAKCVLAGCKVGVGADVGSSPCNNLEMLANAAALVQLKRKLMERNVAKYITAKCLLAGLGSGWLSPLQHEI